MPKENVLNDWEGGYFFSISKEDSPRKKVYGVGVKENDFTLFAECKMIL